MITIEAREVRTPALVYVRSNGRVSPQIWHEPVSDIDHYWRGRIVRVYPLPDLISQLIVVSAGHLRDLAGHFLPPVIKEDCR